MNCDLLFEDFRNAEVLLKSDNSVLGGFTSKSTQTCTSENSSSTHMTTVTDEDGQQCSSSTSTASDAVC
jgi:hypothetical protein